MKHSLFTLILVSASLLFPAVSKAQTSYTCDFEKDSLRQLWTLNPTANDFIKSQIKNWWQLGIEGNNTIRGKYGLYISDDTVSAHYTNVANLVMAYTKVQLDANPNGYKLTFDYRCVGNSGFEGEGLYAFWFPVADDDGNNFRINCVSASSIPATFQDYIIQLDPYLEHDFLRGTATWRQCSVDIPKDMCDGQPHYLAFGWLNSVLAPVQPGACVDNISISDSRACAKPTGLTHSIDGSAVTLSWNGTGVSLYEVSAYSYLERRWYGPYETVDTTYVFTGLAAGMIDFYVRGKCEDDLYSLNAVLNQFIYFPDELCIDYLNLTKDNCFVDNGFNENSNTGTFNKFTNRLVDFGSSSSESRHTIHYDYDEVDPHTHCMVNGQDYALHTVPSDALASVRLGNSEYVAARGGGAERCEFEFVVDTSEFSVLQLKYAVVIEAPNHEPYQNTRFRMNVFRKTPLGWETLGSCAQADFNANSVYDISTRTLTTTDKTWHLSQSITGSAPVVWKDWTTVGVNLTEYHGETLKVQFTTCDCIYHAHFGYAYFTLACTDGQLKGMKCAAINPEFEAPDGFLYRWLLKSDEKFRRADGSPNPLVVKGRDQKYYAGYQDDNVYAVDCMFEQDTSCFFTLYASTLATNPIPQIATPVITSFCQKEQYGVAFKSESYVQEINHIKNDTTISSQRLDSVVWDFGDGQISYDVNPTHYYPSTGGSYTVTLNAYLMECAGTATYTIDLPKIGPTRDTTTVYLCDADKAVGYAWAQTGKNYTVYGAYSDTLFSAATGCDSILTLDLREPWRDTIKTRIMDYQTYPFHGTEYNKPGDYVYTSPACDTAQVLALRIYEALRVKIPSMFYICEGEPNFDLTYDATPVGQCEHYSIKWNDAMITDVAETNLDALVGTQNVDIPATLTPNYYQGEITFYDSISGNVVLPFQLMVRYPASTIVQRWNDILAVTNSEYNGGYTFSDYQWYRTDESGLLLDSIQGAVNSYLSGSPTFTPGDYYTADVTRLSDAVNLLICPVQITNQSAVAEIPTLVQHNTKMLIPGRGVAEWTTPFGVSLGKCNYDNSAIQVPGMKGVLLLVLTDDNAASVHRIVVW